ncbi:MAG: phage holin family protein [Actinomycetota bacterium]
MTTPNGTPSSGTASHATSDTDTMSTGQLVASIRSDVQNLVRGEVELAKAEMRESARRAGIGGALGALAVYLLILVSIMLSIAAAYGLVALDLHPGWAFLIVGGAYLLLAAILGLVAVSRFRRIKGPERAKHVATEITQALRPRPRT